MKTGCDPLRYGLRLTLRHQLILVCYWALVFTAVNACRARDGSLELWNGVSLSMLLTPWILAFLVMAFDRPGPLRNWLVSSLLMLFSPILAIHHDCGTLVSAVGSGQVPNPVGTAILNLFFLGAFFVYWSHMGPVGCPACGRWSLIPLMRLWGQTRRTTNTRWCAACGKLHWRRPGGPWLVERRKTWLDDRPLDIDALYDSKPSSHEAAHSS